MASLSRHFYRSSKYSSATLAKQRIFPLDVKSQSVEDVVRAILADLIHRHDIYGDRVRGSGGIKIVYKDGMASEVTIEIDLNIDHLEEIGPEDKYIDLIKIQDDEIF